MESNELRNQLLSELIGKMQTRLADKEYPDEKKEEAAPVEVVAESSPEAEPITPTSESDDLSDEDVTALLESSPE